MSSDYRKLKECINRIKETTALRGFPRPGLPLAPRINNASEIRDIGGPQPNSSPTSSTTVQGSEAEAQFGDSRLNLLPVLSPGVSFRAPEAPPSIHARVSFQDGPPGPRRTSLRINPYLGHGTSTQTPPLATSWGQIQEEEHGEEMETNDPPSPLDLPSPIIRDPFRDGVESASFAQPVQGSNNIENPRMWTNRHMKVIYECRFSHNATEVQMFSPASIIRSWGIPSLADAHDLETLKF